MKTFPMAAGEIADLARAARVSLSDLKANRAAMTPGPWDYDKERGRIYGPGPNQYLGRDVAEMIVGNHNRNADGIVAVVNAADVLMEVVEAALDLQSALEEKNRDALKRLDAALAKVQR